MELSPALIKEIRRLKEELGITKFAKVTGINNSTSSKWLAANNPQPTINLRHWRKIRLVLDMRNTGYFTFERHRKFIQTINDSMSDELGYEYRINRFIDEYPDLYAEFEAALNSEHPDPRSRGLYADTYDLLTMSIVHDDYFQNLLLMPPASLVKEAISKAQKNISEIQNSRKAIIAILEEHFDEIIREVVNFTLKPLSKTGSRFSYISDFVFTLLDKMISKEVGDSRQLLFYILFKLIDGEIIYFNSSYHDELACQNIYKTPYSQLIVDLKISDVWEFIDKCEFDFMLIDELWEESCGYYELIINSSVFEQLCEPNNLKTLNHKMNAIFAERSIQFSDPKVFVGKLLLCVLQDMCNIDYSSQFKKQSEEILKNDVIRLFKSKINSLKLIWNQEAIPDVLFDNKLGDLGIDLKIGEIEKLKYWMSLKHYISEFIFETKAYSTFVKERGTELQDNKSSKDNG